MQLILIGLASYIIAHLIKFSIKAFDGIPDWRIFFRSGGMPSGHSATVVSVAIASLALYGPSSPIFGLASIFAAIVMYDSLGVRRASGDHSLIINTLIKTVGLTKPIREIIGHTPKEVAAGGLLGAIVGGLATFNTWASHVGFLSTPPIDIERTIYLGVFVFILLFAIIVRLLLSRCRQVGIIKKLKTILWWAFVVPAIVGLFISLLQFQITGPGSWRLWAVLLLAGFAIWQLWLAWRLYWTAPKRYREQKDQLIERRRAMRKSQRRKKSKR